MKTKNLTISLLFASILAFSGCGGGGGSTIADVGGIGGTGISSGVITGFGSVFVNGVEFETNSSSFEVDDNSSSEDSLNIGMVVKVEGTVNDDGITGTATSITYDGNLEGPVATAPITNADGTEVSFTVLNTPVIISASDTTLSDTTLNGLAQGNMVEVSGFYDSNGNLRATYLEKKNTVFVANSTEIEAKGTVANFNGTNQFDLVTGPGISIQVNFGGATELSDLPNNTVTNGLFVEVEGTMSAANATSITATKIENEGYEDDQEDVSIQGLVTDYVSISSFKVAGVPVNGANAELDPTNLTIVEGSSVEAEGNIVNGVLIAEKLEGRDGSIEVHANVSAVDTANGTFTLSIGNGTLIFYTDTQTRFEDNVSEVSGFGVSDISNGDFLEVEAFEDASGNLVASRVQREDQDDDELQGPVDSFVANTSITILNISFTTAGADFQDDSDDDYAGSNDFYSDLDVGDLVKIKDEDSDGDADEVEFELEDEEEYDDEDD